MRSVSVEKVGWSDGEEVNPSSMHELSVPASPKVAATQNNILYARGANRPRERDFAICELKFLLNNGFTALILRG